jgi:hypothetical protein
MPRLESDFYCLMWDSLGCWDARTLARKEGGIIGRVDAATLGLEDVRTPTWVLTQTLPDYPYLGLYLLRSMSPYHLSGTPAHRVSQKGVAGARDSDGQ